MKIGREYLQMRRRLVAKGFIQQQHYQAVGLLASGTADAPYADAVLRTFTLKQQRHYLLLKHLEYVRISKKASYCDLQIIRQRFHFVWLRQQQFQIVGKLPDLV